MQVIDQDTRAHRAREIEENNRQAKDQGLPRCRDFLVRSGITSGRRATRIYTGQHGGLSLPQNVVESIMCAYGQAMRTSQDTTALVCPEPGGLARP